MSEKQTAALQRMIRVCTADGEDIEASVFEVLDDMRRVYEAARVLHGNTRFDLSGAWLADLATGPVEAHKAAETPQPPYRPLPAPQRAPSDASGEPDRDLTGGSDLCTEEIPPRFLPLSSNTYSDDLTLKRKFEKSPIPVYAKEPDWMRKEEKSPIPTHETYYLVTGWHRGGVTTTLVNPERRSHRPQDEGSFFKVMPPAGSESPLRDNHACPICYPKEVFHDDLGRALKEVRRSEAARKAGDG